MEAAASRQSAISKAASTRQDCRSPHLAVIDQAGRTQSEYAMRMSRLREEDQAEDSLACFGAAQYSLL